VTNRTGMTVEEDEFIQDVNCSILYGVKQIAINPGLASTFPWLSRIAGQYESYKWEYLEFYYKRTVSEFAASATSGEVILMLEYDAEGIAPTTKAQALDASDHVQGMPCTPELRIAWDMKQSQNGGFAHFVRSGPPDAGEDIRGYDVGSLNLCTNGMPSSGTAIGELHVRYKVRLSKPLIDPAADTTFVGHWSGIGCTTGNVFGTAVRSSANSAWFNGVTVGSSVITIPVGSAGQYVMLYQAACATSASLPSVSSSTGLVTVNMFTGTNAYNAISQNNAPGIAGTQSGFLSLAFIVASAVCTITLASTIVGNCGMDLFLFKVPSLLNAVQPIGRHVGLANRAVESLLARLERLESMLSGATTPLHIEEEEEKAELVAPVPQTSSRGRFSFR